MQNKDAIAGGSRSPTSQNWLNKSVSRVLGWGQNAEECETPCGHEIVQNLSDQLATHANSIAQLLPHLPKTVSSLTFTFLCKKLPALGQNCGVSKLALRDFVAVQRR